MDEKILIVDDSKIVHKIYQMELSKENYKILHAYDGLEGIEIAGKEKPDIIFLDINLPKLNGYLVCNFLKNHPLTHNIPIILQSSLQEEEVEKLFRNFGFETGADQYLDKGKMHSLNEIIIPLLQHSKCLKKNDIESSSQLINQTEIISFLSNLFEKHLRIGSI